MDKYTNMPHGRFYRAYDALTEAYMNDRLKPFNPCCCFVGNLVAKARGFTFDEHGYWNAQFVFWPLVRRGIAIGIISKNAAQIKESLVDIEPTQYSPHEIVDMEKVFMDASDNRSNDWNAVMATFEYLYSLEDWSDEEKAEADSKLEAFRELQKS